MKNSHCIKNEQIVSSKIGMDLVVPKICILRLVYLIYKIALLAVNTLIFRKYNLTQPTVSGIPFCRKSVRVTQSQNVPVSCLEGHLGTGLRAHVFPQLGVMLNVFDL